MRVFCVNCACICIVCKCSCSAYSAGCMLNSTSVAWKNDFFSFHRLHLPKCLKFVFSFHMFIFTSVTCFRSRKFLRSFFSKTSFFSVVSVLIFIQLIFFQYTLCIPRYKVHVFGCVVFYRLSWVSMIKRFNYTFNLHNLKPYQPLNYEKWKTAIIGLSVCNVYSDNLIINYMALALCLYLYLMS